MLKMMSVLGDTELPVDLSKHDVAAAGYGYPVDHCL